MKRVLPAIGHIRLNRLQPHPLMAFYNNLTEDGMRENNRYRVVVDLKALLQARSMTQADLERRSGVTVNKLIKLANSGSVYLPNAQKNADALEVLREAPEQYRVMVVLLLYTGLRRGELCGLEWSDVDFAQGLLDVQRFSLYIPKQGIFTDETKNSASRRVIKLPPDALTMLRQFRAHQNEQRLMLGDQWKYSNRLFTAWNGSPLHPDTFSKWFSEFVKRYDLPPITAHSLRHTNTTLLIAAGVNVKTVSSHLGHATIATTANIYAHSIKSAEAAAADALQRVLSAAKI